MHFTTHKPYHKMRQSFGGVSLKVAILTFVMVVIGLGFWTWKSAFGKPKDDKIEIVFWGQPRLTERMMPVIRAFEAENPQYRVIYTVPVTKNMVGDAQRLLCAIAGGVPPDVVYFDRFAVGEWASKGAFENLSPWLEKQDKNDPYFIDLDDYYQFSVEEASYRKPGSEDPFQVFGIPTSVDFRMMYINADLLHQKGLKLKDDPNQIAPPLNWEQLSNYAEQLTEITPDGKITRLGFAPNMGNSWLYLYAFQAGGEFLSPDRLKATMDSEPVVRALKYMVDVYDRVGGFPRVDAFQNAQLIDGATDPFIMDKLAMKIDGNWALDTIAEYKRDMNFKVVAPPMPQDQLDAGREPLTWSGGHAYVMPSTSKQKEGAFKLMQYLMSDEALRFMEMEYKEGQEAKGKLYLPRSSAKRKLFEEMVKEEVFENPEIERTYKEAFKAILEVGPNTQIRPVSPVGQMLWNQHMQAYELAVNHSDELVKASQKLVNSNRLSQTEAECRVALAEAQKPVQRQLDNLLNPSVGGKVSWSPYLWGYIVLAIIPFIAIAWAYRAKRKLGIYKASEVGWALFFASPWFVAMFVFIGGPILFSLIISFTQWDVMGDAHYVGLSNYKEITTDPLVATSLENTLYMLIRVPLSMALGLAIAMLMNRAMRGIGTYRTLFYLPAIMPVVAGAYLWLWMLNPQSGPINDFLIWLFNTGPFEWMETTFNNGGQYQAPQWFQDKAWAKDAMIMMNLWAAGSSMIIWLAGLQAIPQHLYEAARIDGAGWWARFRHVTIPMLTPYILFNLIMGTIGTLQIFNEAFMMTQGGPEQSTTFYAYYLFKTSFQYFRMGYASALAWLLFVIVLGLTLLKLWSSKKWVHYQGEK